MVPASRRINLARVACRESTCRIRKIQVNYNIGNRTYNGVGVAPESIAEGDSATVKTTMPGWLVRKLKPGRLSGSVTAVITVTSASGGRLVGSVRTGLTGPR